MKFYKFFQALIMLTTIVFIAFFVVSSIENFKKIDKNLEVIELLNKGTLANQRATQVLRNGGSLRLADSLKRVGDMYKAKADSIERIINQ
jgi:hypothetical protein